MGYTDISFNPSGTKFVTEAGIWDISNQELILNFNRNNENHEVVNASWNNDGSYISMSARDNKVRIYNVETCEIIVVLEGHTGLVHCVAFNPLSNNKVMTLSTDLTMRVWSTVRLV